jgi:hypothetical protein
MNDHSPPHKLYVVLRSHDRRMHTHHVQPGELLALDDDEARVALDRGLVEPLRLVSESPTVDEAASDPAALPAPRARRAAKAAR